MQSRAALAAAIASFVTLSPSASALVPGDLYAVSGKPSANAFLPGLANDSSLGLNTRKLSDDGRYVAFVSEADGLSPADDDRFANVYVQDRDTGAVEVVGVPAPAGSAAGDSLEPAISGNGRRVAFTSTARLSPQDTEAQQDVYVRDLDAGTTTLISITSGGAQGTGVNNDPDISHDGTKVAFASTVQTTFASADNDADYDVYVTDATVGLRLVSHANNDFDVTAAGHAQGPAVRDSGSVAFHTTADNLVGPADTDTVSDVYVNSGSGTQLMSRADGAGAKGNGASSDPAFGDDGSVVAFTSGATNLDAADVSPNSSVYARVLGSGDTVLVSRQSDAVGGASANGSSTAPTVSDVPGETRVAFASTATNINPAFTDSSARVWVRALTAGTTALVSRRDGVGERARSTSGAPSIATQGTAVAFTSDDPDLSAEDDDDFGDVFVRDGITTTWRSRPAPGSAWLGGAGSASIGGGQRAISADGRYVAFTSGSNVYLPAGAGDPGTLLLVRDLLTGEVTVAARADGADGAPVSVTEYSISGNGQLVAFVSDQALVAGVPGGTDQAYVRDRVAGMTRLASRLADAPGNDTSSAPAISTDGRWVAFVSRATNFGVTSLFTHVYLHDLTTGDTTLVSRDSDGTPADEGGSLPSVSADGARVAFSTTAKNLDPADTDAHDSIYVRDRTAQTTTLVSTGAGGAPNDGAASFPVISDDGTRVAFGSPATNLDTADTDGVRSDVFVRDLAAGTTTLVSQPGNGSFATVGFDLSADGRTVAWTTREPMLADDTDTELDAYGRDLGSGTTTLIGRKGTGEPLEGGMTSPALSADGGCVAMNLTGAGTLADGPILSPNLPGSTPSPDFRTVLLRALKPTCAAPPPAPPLPQPIPTPTPTPTPTPGPVARDVTAPLITAVSWTNRRFRRTAKPTAINAATRRRAKAGTALRLTLSEPAAVVVAFERRTTGRRVGKTCRKATARLRARKRCTRYERRGTLTRKALKQGANRIAFSGRLGRKALPLGSYRATLRATDTAGNRSAARRSSFAIVRR